MMSMDFKPGWCSTCHNTGWVNCYCGGDLCVCENNGEEPCPMCGGESAYDPFDEECDEAPLSGGE